MTMSIKLLIHKTTLRCCILHETHKRTTEIYSCLSKAFAITSRHVIFQPSLFMLHHISLHRVPISDGDQNTPFRPRNCPSREVLVQSRTRPFNTLVQTGPVWAMLYIFVVVKSDNGFWLSKKVCCSKACYLDSNMISYKNRLRTGSCKILTVF